MTAIAFVCGDTISAKKSEAEHIAPECFCSFFYFGPGDLDVEHFAVFFNAEPFSPPFKPHLPGGVQLGKLVFWNAQKNHLTS